MLIGKLNPVVLSGFDILFFGTKGFSSLARAKRIKARVKGSKGTWTEVVFTKRIKTKLQKENVLFRLLQKLTYARDLAAKKKKPKKSKKVKKKKSIKKRRVAPKPLPTRDEQAVIIQEREPKLKKQILFYKPVMTPKAITTRAKKQIFIEKYEYKLKREINFSQGGEYQAGVVNQFIMAVKDEFKKLYKKYGRTGYLVRIEHSYNNMPNYYDVYPEDRPKGDAGKDVPDKGFGGYSLNRQNFESLSFIDDQFNFILTTKYLTSFSRYLNFANPSTEFNFSGFMVEVTVRKIPKNKRK